MRVLILIEDVPRTRHEIPIGEPTGGVSLAIAHDSTLDPAPETPALRLARRIAAFVKAQTEADDPPSTEGERNG